MLVLDTTTDALPLMDMNVLFDSATFASHAGVFWPSMVARDPDSPLWSTMGLRGSKHDQPAMRLDTAQMLVSKSRAWKALRLAQHLLTDGRYYSESFGGDAEVFFWAMAATETRFFQEPGLPEVLGTVVDVQRSNAEVAVPRGEPAALPDGAAFCGAARAHGWTDGGAVGGGSLPQAAFLHADFETDRGGFDTDRDFFRAVAAYVAVGSGGAARVDATGLAALERAPIGEGAAVPGLRKCMSLRPVDGLVVAVAEWSSRHRGVVEKFWHVYNRVK
ncbi:hypothetical protein HK405_000921 [Cladochytrium tenue]|nr:hypothetical protein HK405_000921 [Cladochytrium tenue]